MVESKETSLVYQHDHTRSRQLENRVDGEATGGMDHLKALDGRHDPSVYDWGQMNHIMITSLSVDQGASPTIDMNTRDVTRRRRRRQTGDGKGERNWKRTRRLALIF